MVVTSNVISINQKTKIFFIPDKEDARVYGNFLGNVASSGSQASVYWNGTNTVMGKIAVLVYTTGLIPTLRVVSYDRLYEINNVQLTNGATTQLNIDSSFTFTDPVERNITVNINEFSGTNPAIVRLCLRAQNYIQAEQFESLESSYPNGLYSTIIPEVIPEYFTFYLKGDKFGTAFEMSRGIQSLSTNSSTQLLNIYKPVGFSSPAQNGAVTLYGGQFSWESSEGTGIYELGIALQSDNKLIKIFTTSINTTIPDLSALGFSYQGNGQPAVYDVKKYYGPGGIDDFTKENYFRSELNKGQSTSSYIDISVN